MENPKLEYIHTIVLPHKAKYKPWGAEFIKLAIMCFIAFFTFSNACADTVPWKYGNSIFNIDASNVGKISIKFANVRADLIEEGVAPGTILFKGEGDGAAIKGTIVAFSKNCGNIEYEANGLYNLERGMIYLSATAPIRNKHCKIIERRAVIKNFVRVDKAPADMKMDPNTKQTFNVDASANQAERALNTIKNPSLQPLQQREFCKAFEEYSEKLSEVYPIIYMPYGVKLTTQDEDNQDNARKLLPKMQAEFIEQIKSVIGKDVRVNDWLVSLDRISENNDSIRLDFHTCDRAGDYYVSNGNSGIDKIFKEAMGFTDTDERNYKITAYIQKNGSAHHPTSDPFYNLNGVYVISGSSGGDSQYREAPANKMIEAADVRITNLIISNLIKQQ